MTLQRRPLERKEFVQLIRTAGGHRSGLPPELRSLPSAVFAKTLTYLATTDLGQDPAALSAAAEALNQMAHVQFHMRLGAQRILSTLNEQQILDRTRTLQPGHHFYIGTTLSSEMGHALGVVVSRHRDDPSHYEVGILNSMGWENCFSTPVRSKHVTLHELERSLPVLIKDDALLCNPWLTPSNKAPLERNHLVNAYAWADPLKGSPLLDWLTQRVCPDQAATPCFLGRAVHQKWQKSDDCAIENCFILLTAVLPPVQYKLAKAACLSALVDVAKALEPSTTVQEGGSPRRGELATATHRLTQRQTSALRASVATSSKRM